MTAGSVMSGDFPAVGVVAGHSVALHYGNVAAEYHALRTGAILVDRSARGRTRIEGPRAQEMVTGLVTNDALSLRPGHGQYAVALNAKGKIVADLRLFARDDHLLADVSPRAQAGWLATVRKFINPRIAPYRDESTALRELGVFGVEARRMVGEATGLAPDALGALPVYAQLVGEAGGRTVLVARVPDLELEGYDLLVPADGFTVLWSRLAAAGATPAGLLAWDIARIEAGRPEWGVDMDESTIPQEANMDELHAISYTKGCYTGQEVVARVHFRGHVNRMLRGLRAGQAEPPPARAALLDESNKQVGEVRSSAVSPRLGVVALAMVRREIEPGATLRVQWDGGESQADVIRLPFPL